MLILIYVFSKNCVCRLDSTAGCEVLGHRDTNTDVGCRSKRHASFVEAELSKLGHTYVMTNEEERIRQQMASLDVSKGDEIQFDHGRYHSGYGHSQRFLLYKFALSLSQLAPKVAMIIAGAL